MHPSSLERVHRCSRAASCAPPQLRRHRPLRTPSWRRAGRKSAGAATCRRLGLYAGPHCNLGAEQELDRLAGPVQTAVDALEDGVERLE